MEIKLHKESHKHRLMFSLLNNFARDTNIIVVTFIRNCIPYSANILKTPLKG